MSAKAHFKYPAKPSSVKAEDWNELKRGHESINEPASEAPVENPLEAVTDKSETTTSDSGSLTDFIKRFMVERQKKLNPEDSKRHIAISAYQKNKKSA